MLQDLDARSTAGREAADLYAKPVARGAGRGAAVRVLVGGAVVVGLSVGATLTWRHLRGPAGADLVPRVATAEVARPVELAPPERPQVTPAASASAASAASAPAAGATLPPARAAAAPAVPAATVAAVPAPNATPALAPVAAARGADASPARPSPAARAATVAAPEGGEQRPLPARPRAVKPLPASVDAGKTVVTAAEQTPAQKAEAAYRRALANLADGWQTEAIAALEQAVQANPAHEAARQMLVGLLVENKRTDEAVRQLEAGLAAEPRQTALAMLLARLQIERGGNGIDTLMRSLPYAANHADYHAMLAGALQRDHRAGEAAEQYLAALRLAPNKAVWWMGLGIALQGDNRKADALEAFRRAKGQGGLTPDLQTFVDRQIELLAR